MSLQHDPQQQQRAHLSCCHLLYEGRLSHEIAIMQSWNVTQAFTCRSMDCKLQQLWTESLSSSQQAYSTMHLNGIPALAIFLSYLTFQAPATSGASSIADQQSRPDSDLYTDLARAGFSANNYMHMEGQPLSLENSALYLPGSIKSGDFFW